jgi:hypothetical protein
MFTKTDATPEKSQSQRVIGLQKPSRGTVDSYRTISTWYAEALRKTAHGPIKHPQSVLQNGAWPTKQQKKTQIRSAAANAQASQSKTG